MSNRQPHIRQEMPKLITVACSLAPPIRSPLNRPDGELLAGIHPYLQIERVLLLAGFGTVTQLTHGDLDGLHQRLRLLAGRFHGLG